MKSIYNFDEFVAPRLKDKAVWPRNSYVSFPGWLNLYVRVTSRHLNGEERGMVIDLANIEARAKGKGTFKKLIAHIRKTYPGTVIHVEEVLSERFREGLPRLGFIPRRDHPTSFFLLPEIT